MTNLVEDYKITTLSDLINNYLNPKHQSDAIWMQRYLALHSVFYYFEYSTGMVQTQESALVQKLPDAIICGSAISAYANMSTCLKLLKKALLDFTDPKIESIAHKYSKEIARIKHIRDRLAAHPYEAENSNSQKEKFLISKRSGYNSDGLVWIRQVSYDQALQNQSEKFELTPRVDLENLRNYLSEVSAVLIKLWS